MPVPRPLLCCFLLCLPDDSASQPGHHCTALSEELGHSFSPNASQRLHSRAQFIPKRGERDTTRGLGGKKRLHKIKADVLFKIFCIIH